jgi:uncharacterized protein
MRIVLDTNCFLAILPKHSKYRSVFDAYRKGVFELAVSTEILDEYSEIFTQKMTSDISENLLELILKQPNTLEIEIFYRWLLITSDFDDNKFVDTAISANVDFIVTFDRHYNVLKTTPFPKVQVINLDEFIEVLNDI